MDETIRGLLTRHRVVHVLGLSDNPARDSHHVAVYLQSAGYRTIPINPMVSSVLGERSFGTLAEAQASEPIRLLDVFRRGDTLDALVPELDDLPELEAVWFQLGVHNAVFAEALRARGVMVIEDRCIKVEHARLFR